MRQIYIIPDLVAEISMLFEKRCIGFMFFVQNPGGRSGIIVYFCPHKTMIYARHGAFAGYLTHAESVMVLVQ